MHRCTELAEFVSSVNRLPPSTVAAGKRVLLDTVGAAVAGAMTAGGIAALKAARCSWGEGTARVWFSDERLTAAGAAFVNSAYASMLDLDDGHRAAAGHPGASIVPAVLSVAEVLGVTSGRLLTAIAIGYEIALRVSASRDINATRTTDTGRWCGYGVASAVGWLHGLPASMIAQAMAIAGHTASSQAATGWTRLGHNVKEGIPFATAAGITAVELAMAGFTGPIDLLDDADRYDQAGLVDGLGKTWEIERGYFKIYSACRWAHAPIDAALQLQQSHHIAAADIGEIQISLFARALTLLNLTHPPTIDAAQYSVPFCVALALVHGRGALLPLTNQYLSDPAVTGLAERVQLIHDPDLDPMFPRMTPVRFSLRHGDRSDHLDIDAPKGEPSNPLSQNELEEKFDALTHGRLTMIGADRLKSAILAIDDDVETGRLFQVMGEKIERYNEDRDSLSA